MNICNISECTGCFACKAVCPRKAIEVREDGYGSTIPYILEDKCIECGLCKSVCMVNQKPDLVKPQKCYAVWTKNEEDRKLCSSGGVSTGIARQIIKRGGVVFGAAYTGNLEIEIIPANTEEELKRFRGSKYVQCNTGNSYAKAKEYLENNKEVLYVGTPCQVAGLKKYLQKKYDNLLTIDIICHGAPPVKYLQEYCSEKFKGKSITKVTFRGKRNYYFTAYENEKIIYSKPSYSDFYFLGFLAKVMFRENCYSCNFAQENRAADITIGDFWGLNRSTLKQAYNGRISVVLLNTGAGKRVFDYISEQFFVEERELKEAVDGNAQLHRPSEPHRDRMKFLKNYGKKGMLGALKTTGLNRDLRINQIKGSIIFKTIKKAAGKIRKLA